MKDFKITLIDPNKKLFRFNNTIILDLNKKQLISFDKVRKLNKIEVNYLIDSFNLSSLLIDSYINDFGGQYERFN